MAKGEPGRPREFTERELQRISRLNCTQAEIASYFGMTLRAVEIALQQPALREAYEQGRRYGMLSIRRAQYRAALKGNTAMLIWLGKQLLGQKDEVITTHTGTVTITDDTARRGLEAELVRALSARGSASSAIIPTIAQ